MAASWARPGGLARRPFRRLLGRLANLGGYQGSYGVSLPPQPGRERRTSTREHLVRIIMDQKPSAMLRRGLHMSSSSTSTTSSFLIDDILVQRPKVTCRRSFSSERLCSLSKAQRSEGFEIQLPPSPANREFQRLEN